jgi:hypothetical protein
LSLRSPLRPRNRGKKAVPTGTPAPTLLPKGRPSPSGAGGIPTPRKLPTSRLVPGLVFSALKARQENRPNEKTTPSPKRCPEDLEIGGEAPSPPSAIRPSALPMSGPHHGPPPQGHGGHQSGPRPGKRVRHEIPRPAPGPIPSRTGAPPEGPSSCPCAFCPGVARGQDDGSSTLGRAERAPRKASPLPPRLGQNGPGS